MRRKRKSVSGKKYVKDIGGRRISFGARGYSISPGTSRGDSYCARSLGIQRKYPGSLRNRLSRQAWGCVGSKSVKSKAVKFKYL